MREIDIDQLAAALPGGAVVVDVREPAEYAGAHIPGAVNIAMGRLTSCLDQLDRSSPVHVVCASGNRSTAMTDVLLAQGFDAVNVTGGTSAWVRSGRPVARGTEAGAAR
ncbi:rhodanese-like domain-containing protein [Nocardioides sp. cx-169]|uniref:rhodanese-like domain-containing protein n=1 Tax=Nocardioides sp. cx-169 TaxID=2899080 RepID=UPI001E30FA7A|nr:rhodanese-like domain-containing protein [Nocardioides sp. cx-169]MCD4535520.1 rhodanese-like domain-containing protein [Nocardioides sp. cx-169]